MVVNHQGEGARLVRIDDLRRCLRMAFERLGLAPEDAEGLGGLLVDSELRGHPDHGVAGLGTLATFFRDGKLNPRPRVRVLRETDGAILLDGDRGAGPGAPTRAMRWCIERARERKGMAVAAIRDWQLLVAAPYARLAAEAGLVGFACTNFIPLVAPPGGRTAVFGTNPFAYGLPAQRHPPVVLDVATTVSSMQWRNPPHRRHIGRVGSAWCSGLHTELDPPSPPLIAWTTTEWSATSRWLPPHACPDRSADAFPQIQQQRGRRAGGDGRLVLVPSRSARRPRRRRLQPP